MRARTEFGSDDVFSSSIMLFFIASIAFVGIKFGTFVGLGCYVGWSLGMILASKLIEDLGRVIQHADRIVTITGSQRLDFVLAAFWPGGIPIICGIGIGRRVFVRP